MTSRALVLGVAGPVERAWAVGLLAGIAVDGVRWQQADLLVGTSTGGLLAAQLGSGADPERLCRDELAGSPVLPPRPRPAGWLALRLAFERRRSADPVRYRNRVGRLARGALTPAPSTCIDQVRAALPRQDWPAQRLLIPVVDGDSGEFAALGRDSGATLPEAVAAGCAVPGVWPPIELDGRHWMDGGIRSGANVDLAMGCDRVLVVACPSGSGPGPGRIASVTEQIERFPATAQVLLVGPGAASRRLLARRHGQGAGRAAARTAVRVAALRSGRADAQAVRSAVAELWLG